MSAVVIAGNTSGSVTLSAPDVAGTTTLTLPATTATIATNVNGNLYPLTSGTSVTASGTSVTFTGIPSWVKRITVMFSGVSTNGTSHLLIQLGAGSVTTSGYNVYGVNFGGAGLSGAGYTNGYAIRNGSASDLYSGSLNVNNLNGVSWAGQGMFASSASSNGFGTSGSITLGGALDRVRITTVNGTDTFDAGSINILYE